MPGTRKLGRPTAHRMSMLKGMVTFLLEKGQIETTATRAKEVSALADKMITLGKANTLASRRQAIAFLKKESVVKQLFSLIAPFYIDRNGGYTRVLKTGPRRGDGAEMAVIMLVEADELYAKAKKEDKKEAKKTAKKDTKKENKKEEKVEKTEKEEVTETVEKTEEKPVKKTTSKKPKADE